MVPVTPGKTKEEGTEVTATDTTGEDLSSDAIELIFEIVQLFEDFLWSHDGKVRNTEPKVDEWTSDDIIYGHQREELIEDLVTILADWQLI